MKVSYCPIHKSLFDPKNRIDCVTALRWADSGNGGHFEESDGEWVQVMALDCKSVPMLLISDNVEQAARAVGEMFLYPDPNPNREGNWMGPGIEASRQVVSAVLNALDEED